MAPKPPGSRTQSREAPKEAEGSYPQPQPQPKAEPEKRGRSRSTRRGRSPSLASTISDSGPEEIFPPESRKKRKNKRRQNALPALDEVETTGKEVVNTAQNAVNTVGNTAGAVAGSGGGDKPLKLRLDLNLDADIRLTAKVHGDVTLSLFG